MVHEALAVVSYDGKAKSTAGSPMTCAGRHSRWNRSWWTVASNGAFRSEEGGVTVRFTIQFDAQRWHEVGEMSADGKSWNKFLEMTLERQG